MPNAIGPQMKTMTQMKCGMRKVAAHGAGECYWSTDEEDGAGGMPNAIGPQMKTMTQMKYGTRVVHG
jgi:hypothetical protein